MHRCAARSRPLRGDGRAQRDAGLVLRRRPVPGPRRRASRTGVATARAGADLVDVGGESTRPGRAPGGRRTRDRPGGAGDHARWPRTACRAAWTPPAPRSPRPRWRPARSVVNDVSGGLADPDDGARWWPTPACPWILMHWRGHSDRTWTRWPRYDDVVADVRAELVARVDAARGGRGGRRARWCSTPASASRRRPSTTGRCCGGLGRAARAGVSRCWSARPASVSSAPCSPTRTAPRAAGRPGGRRPPRSPRWPPRPASWGVRVHEVAALAGRRRGGAAWQRRLRPGRRAMPASVEVTMTDRITLTGLRVRGHHGVFEHEGATARTSSSTSRCGWT